jgi:nucleoside phosphorylase
MAIDDPAPRQGLSMETDCVILAALKKETKSVLFQFRNFQEVATPGQTFSCYKTVTPNGLRVVAASPTAMGNLAMASLTHTVISTFRPKTLLLVGIAGGLDKEIPLGDVVVSDQIVHYELGKITAEGFTPRWSVYRPDPELLERARSWPNQNWQQYIRAVRPAKAGAPMLHSGILLSGDKVIADDKTADALRSVWRKAAAIDMEAAGAASALYHMKSPPSFLVFRGICDYADHSKNDIWQEYAADAAASCAFSFVLDHLKPSDVRAAQLNGVGRIAESQTDNREIRVALTATYNLAELKRLSFDLGVDWEDLAGDSKSEKIIELLLSARRHNKIGKLVDLVNHERDGVLSAYVGRAS